VTEPSPAPWAVALVAILAVAVFHRAALGTLASVSHFRAHRGAHLILVLSR